MLVCLHRTQWYCGRVCRVQSPCHCSSRRTRTWQEHSTETTTLHPETMRGPSSLLTTNVSPEGTASAIQPRVMTHPRATGQGRRRSPRAAEEIMRSACGARGATRRYTSRRLRRSAWPACASSHPPSAAWRSPPPARAGQTSDYLTLPHTTQVTSISRTVSAWAGDKPPGTQSVEPDKRPCCACMRFPGPDGAHRRPVTGGWQRACALAPLAAATSQCMAAASTNRRPSSRSASARSARTAGLAAASRSTCGPGARASKAVRGHQFAAVSKPVRQQFSKPCMGAYLPAPERRLTERAVQRAAQHSAGCRGRAQQKPAVDSLPSCGAARCRHRPATP